MTRDDRFESDNPKHTEEWHEFLNANWEQATDEIAIRRPESELGNWPPTSRAEFVATDTGSVRQGDGGNWNPAERAFGSISDVYFAREYDGADGGEQIQNALDAAAAAVGRVAVVITPDGPDSDSDYDTGIWLCSSKIVPGSNTGIIGAGMPVLKLADGTNDDLIQTDDTTFSGDRKTNIRIENLVLDGNGKNQTGEAPNQEYGMTGIRMMYVDNGLIRNVVSTDFGDVDDRDPLGYGIEVKLSYNITVEGCYAARNGDDGFSVSNAGQSSSDCQHITVKDCYATDNNDVGFEVDDGPRHVRYVRCHSEANRRRGFDIHAHAGEENPQFIEFRECVSTNDPGTSNTGGPFTIQSLDDSSTAEARGYKFIDCVIEDAEMGLTILKSGAVSDVEIRGMDIEVSNYSVGGIEVRKEVNGLTIDNCEVHVDSTRWGIISQAELGPHSDIRITDCDITGSDANGIWLRAINNTIDHVRVSGCRVDNVGLDTGESDDLRSGVFIGRDGEELVTDVIATENDVSNSGNYGIQLGDPQVANALVTENIVHNNPTGGIGGSGDANSVVTDNID